MHELEVGTGQFEGNLARRVLDLLIEHAPDPAIATCQQLVDADHELSRTARRGIAVLDPARTAAALVAARPEADELVEVIPALAADRLSADARADLARLLLDRFPIAEDPPLDRVFNANPWFETREVRRRILEHLAEEGEFRPLEQLATGRTGIERTYLARLVRRARARAADLAFEPPTPQGLLQLLSRQDARLVRSSADLLEVVAAQLGDIEDRLQRQHASRFLWNLGAGGDARPKSEEEISDWVSDELEQRLGRGSVVDREIEVARRASSGIGTRIDLTATRTTATHPPSTARVIIEAKLLNNRELLGGLRAQLVERYLLPSGWTHGIYLVYWVPDGQRPDAWSSSLPTTRQELIDVLDQQNEVIDSELTIQTVVLDIGRP